MAYYTSLPLALGPAIHRWFPKLARKDEKKYLSTTWRHNIIRMCNKAMFARAKKNRDVGIVKAQQRVKRVKSFQG